MKKMLNIRNNIIIILCITIVLMAIGFIVISVKLNAYKEKEESFDIVFYDVAKKTSVKGSTKEPLGNVVVDQTGKILNMSFSLFAAHDELTYVATIKNKGTLPAKIVKVFGSPDYNIEPYSKQISPVSITTTDIEGKTLLPGEELEYKITVYYTPSVDGNKPKNFSYNLALITESN